MCSRGVQNSMKRHFLMVDAAVLPEVFLKVLKAKELLASGEARNISAATRAVDLSRSAFYKYKDCIFDARSTQQIITVLATLLDENGALQALLGGISAAGGSVVTINQATPENGAAKVEVTVRTDTLRVSIEEMLAQLAQQRAVVEVHQGV
ncbi:amino acid-binding protein [Gemmiger sp. An87]|nr:amino acid-binding protein [Gemmiger sp. An87]OUN86719.1 amino acid-binding protein [Gemmiger sp. An50]OUP24359.1 amino acid-binding protein [Gemmiger sp. An194]